jgi:internalin A
MRLLVVTLCCFLAPPIVRADPTEDAVIEAIKRLHGTVEQNGKVVGLSSTEATDADLKHLAALKNLSILNLTETRVTNAGLEHVAALRNLTTLTVLRPRPQFLDASEPARMLSLNDAGMKELAALRNLTTLSLSVDNVTATGLKEFASLRNLTALDLAWTKLPDAGRRASARRSRSTGASL